MDSLRIYGGTPLHGKITVSGAKNAALPIMAAALLSSKPLIIKNMPNLADIHSTNALLESLGATVKFDISPHSFAHTLTIDSSNITSLKADYELVRKMRASILVLGPMLARFKHAEVSLPGGCAIGARPVDMHLDALREMGADIKLEHGYVIANAPEGLKGADIMFSKVSVGATENALMAATLASGKTILRNAAREPEIVDLADCLIAMGAKISGHGTDVIEVEGVKELHGATHNLMPDRIEAGTFAIAAAATHGKLTIENCRPDHLGALTHHLRSIGVTVEESQDTMVVYRSADNIESITFSTAPYPNFPTDLQAQFMTLLTIARGVSHVTETIFENRFMHVNELLRMGADIQLQDNTAIINGVEGLQSAEVMASDLRASVSLVIASMCAPGESTIHRIYHLDRGYERIEDKLNACGAKIERFNANN